MKRKAPVFMVFLLLTVLAVPAFAASPPNYVAIKLGAYLPQASDVENFDDSFYGELAFGHYFNPNIAAEFGVGYTKPGASVTEGTSSVDVDLTIVPITLGVKALYPLGNFEPFVEAGIGLYYAKVEASATIPGATFSGSENDTALGFYLGAGANFNITPNIFIGLEGKYFWAKPSFSDVDVKIDGINLTANLGYRF